MVAIKDMEMPSSCINCDIRSGSYCYTKNKPPYDIKGNLLTRDDDCPLVEIEERKVGKWIVKDNGNGDKYVECPFCGALAPSTEFADRTVWKYSKFCYDCGNDMRGTENG